MPKVKKRHFRDDEDALVVLTNLFGATMRDRFLSQADDGWVGWRDKDAEGMSDYDLKLRIIRNVLNGDWVDAANLAAMAWNLYE